MNTTLLLLCIAVGLIAGGIGYFIVDAISMSSAKSSINFNAAQKKIKSELKQKEELYEKEKEIIINDLYSVVASDIDKYIRKDDKIHLTQEGIKVCSKQVAKTIIEVAETLGLEEKEKLISSIFKSYFKGFVYSNG